MNNNFPIYSQGWTRDLPKSISDKSLYWVFSPRHGVHLGEVDLVGKCVKCPTIEIPLEVISHFHSVPLEPKEAQAFEGPVSDIPLNIWHSVEGSKLIFGAYQKYWCTTDKGLIIASYQALMGGEKAYIFDKEGFKPFVKYQPESYTLKNWICAPETSADMIDDLTELLKLSMKDWAQIESQVLQHWKE